MPASLPRPCGAGGGATVRSRLAREMPKRLVQTAAGAPSFPAPHTPRPRARPAVAHPSPLSPAPPPRPPHHTCASASVLIRAGPLCARLLMTERGHGGERGWPAAACADVPAWPRPPPPAAPSLGAATGLVAMEMGPGTRTAVWADTARRPPNMDSASSWPARRSRAPAPWHTGTPGFGNASSVHHDHNHNYRQEGGAG